MINPDQIALLDGLAVLGTDFPRRRQAEALVRHLAPDMEESANLQEAAFLILVRAGYFGEDENLSLRRNLIPATFSAAALAEVELILDAQEHILHHPSRSDRTGLLTLAIDDDHTSEVDDAVSATVTPEGDIQVGVHITDVAAQVPAHGEIDREAAQRGVTLYLPECRMNMLPPSLGEGPASLAPGQLRATISFFITVTPEGETVNTTVEKSRIRLTRRLSYEAADRFLEASDGDQPRGQSQAVVETLSILQKVAERRRAMRLAAGALAMDMPDVRLVVDRETGRVQMEQIATHSRSRRLVAEMMILTGHVAACLMRENRIPALYRVQAPPSGALLEGNTQHHGSLVDCYATLRNLKKAVASTVPGRHHALGLDCYTQISSPLRRYSDLAMQRQLTAHLGGYPPPLDQAELSEACSVWEPLTFAAGRIERESRRYWSIKFLCQQEPGRTYQGVVLEEQERYRYRVELDNMCIQGHAMADTPLTVGDRVELRLLSADPRQNQLDLNVIRRLGNLYY